MTVKQLRLCRSRWGAVPSHLERSSTLIGSSLGGSSLTGFLGAKPLGSEDAMLAGVINSTFSSVRGK